MQYSVNRFLLLDCQYEQITPHLAYKILLQFDRSINKALVEKVKNRLTFKVRDF